MNSDQIGGIVRAVGGVAVGYLVGNGYITSDVGAWLSRDDGRGVWPRLTG